MVTIRNLVGSPLTVAGVVIPSEGVRALIPLPPTPAPLTGLSTNYGDIPVGVDFLAKATLADVVMSDGSTFPEARDSVILLAPLPVRNAALRAGRTDVWGMGDRVSPKDPDAGVKYLVR